MNRLPTTILSTLTAGSLIFIPLEAIVAAPDDLHLDNFCLQNPLKLVQPEHEDVSRGLLGVSIGEASNKWINVADSGVDIVLSTFVDRSQTSELPISSISEPLEAINVDNLNAWRVQVQFFKTATMTRLLYASLVFTLVISAAENTLKTPSSTVNSKVHVH